MSGIIGAGRKFAHEAMQGMGEAARMETARNAVGEQLAEAKKAQQTNTLTSGMGLGAAIGPKVLPKAASALGIHSTLLGNGIMAIPEAAGLPSALTGSAGSVGLMEGAAAGASTGAAAAAPALAALGPIAIGALAVGGLTYLLSDIF